MNIRRFKSSSSEQKGWGAQILKIFLDLKYCLYICNTKQQ